MASAPIYIYDEAKVHKYLTDENGIAEIKIEKYHSLRITYVGYNPLTITKGEENNYRIRLNPSEPIGVKLTNENGQFAGKKFLNPGLKNNDTRMHTGKKPLMLN